MKISIIVPVYNVEKYLSRCLDSILNQDMALNDYEIIIVNDGSTDKSGDICLEYASKYSNIRYFEQKNQGQSVARNVGLKNATGEYIWFIDSDDFIESNSLYGLYKKAVSNNLDILSFVLKKISENNHNDIYYECVQNLKTNYIYTGRDAFLEGYKPASVCNTLFRRDFILNNKLRFYPGIIHQDVEFSFQAIIVAKTVMFIENCPYMYYFRRNSTLTNPLPEKIIKRYVDDGIVASSIKGTASKYQNDIVLYNRILTYSNSIVFGCVYSLWRQHHTLNSTIINNVLTKYREFGLYPISAPYKTIMHFILAKIVLNRKLFW